jgi:hypothetical protein
MIFVRERITGNQTADRFVFTSSDSMAFSVPLQLGGR